MMGGTYRLSGLPRPSWRSSTTSAQPVYETQKVEGHRRHAGVLYRDDLVRIVIDVPDVAKNRQWMKQFKKRWLDRLEQLELWMVSYRIELE
jgi:hypothetical protein